MSDAQQSDVIYEEIQQKLASANASIEAAEVHGVICGVIASDKALPETWFEEVFDQAEPGDLLVEEAKTRLHALYKDTIEQIEGAGMGMQLLLPAEETSLPTRAQAVTEWCQGFLYGIGLSGEQASQKLSSEAREAIEDISALTRMDTAALGDVENLEEEEDALMEITEFLWVAAMLIRESFLDQNSAEQLTVFAADDGAGHDYH